jgi:uncharacterized RDD family membrane protein YckC
MGIVFGLIYTSGAPAVVYAALVLDYLVLFAYSIYLHGHFGQTIGKWVMKVQVLSVEETPLSMRQAFLRDSLSISLAVVYLLFAIEPVFAGISPESREFKRHIPLAFVSVGLLVFVLEVVTMLTNSKRRSIHDFIAGSVVVRRSNSTVERDARQSSARPSP